MKRIWAVVRSERQSYVETLLIMLGLMLLFTVIEVGCTILFHEEEWTPLGVIGTISMGVMALMFLSGAQFAVVYNRALRHGVIRKKALLGALGSLLVTGLIFLGVALLAYGIEIVVCYLTFFSELRIQQVGEFMVSGFLPTAGGIVGGTLAGVCVWGTITGALIMKYGKKAFWGWYILFFGFMFLAQIVEENAVLNRLISRIPALSPLHWVVLGCVAVVALLVVTVRMAYRMEVLDTFG